MNRACAMLTLSLLCLTGMQVRAGVYTWVDEEGVRHFSDTPVEGAEPVRVSPPNTYTPPAPARGAVAPSAGRKKLPDAVRYQAIEILSPEDGQTIRENSGTISVAVKTVPALASVRGHRIEVVLDGTDSRVSEQGSVTFENVPRGTHRLIARILDENGNVLLESAPVTFHLHRYSALLDAPPEGTEGEGAETGPIRRAPAMPRAPMAPRAPRYPNRR